MPSSPARINALRRSLFDPVADFRPAGGSTGARKEDDTGPRLPTDTTAAPMPNLVPASAPGLRLRGFQKKGYRYDHFRAYLYRSDDYGLSWRASGKTSRRSQ